MITYCKINLKSLLIQHNICVIWRRVSDTTSQTLAFWHSLLDKRERERACKFRFREDQHSYIAAHALLRQSLSAITEANPSSWQFINGKYGKPEVNFQLDMRPLRVNISHTRGMVAVALVLEYDIGVDTEALTRVVEEKFWDHVLAPEEALQISHIPAQSQPSATIALWTLKESLVKASGQGLHARLDSIVCGIKPPRLLHVGALTGAPLDWKIWQLSQDDAFVVTVAVHAPGTTKLTCRFLEASPR